MTDRGIRRCRRGMAAALAAGLVLSLGLAGCDDDNDDPADSGLPSEDEVTTEPSTSPSSTPTPTPTEPAAPEPPTIPAAATKAGRAGASAFVEFYIDLENYARHTGDVQPLRQYSHPECGGCNYFVRYYRDLYERGGWIRRGSRTISSFDRAVPAVSPHDMYVRISGRTESGIYRRSQGTPVKSGHGQSYTLLVWLLREAQGWRVSKLDTTS